MLSSSRGLEVMHPVKLTAQSFKEVCKVVSRNLALSVTKSGCCESLALCPVLLPTSRLAMLIPSGF